MMKNSVESLALALLGAAAAELMAAAVMNTVVNFIVIRRKIDEC